jgi:alpha-beta hydrolase superfamily lysophospholipase
MRDPRLDAYHQPAAPRALVLMLHGGQEHSTDDVTNRHASWWRLALMARSLRSWADENDLALHLLQYRVRGWNSSDAPAPVSDARWALDRLDERHSGLPVVIVGHSMGGRAGCRVADDPAVAGVVALAPWLPEGEPNASIAGRHLHVIHGTRDRWTSAHWSRDYVERSQRTAASATWTPLPGVGHFMLRRTKVWNRFVKDSITDILALRSLRPPTGESAPSHEGSA